MRLIIGLCALLLSTVASANNWDFDVSDDLYGDDRIALITTTLNSNGNKAALVVRCTPVNNDFELYVAFGEQVTAGLNKLRVQFQVDRITPFSWIDVDSGGDNDSAFIIDNKLNSSETSNLMQEMFAGRSILFKAVDQLNSGKILRARFSLIGFTRTWNDTCGMFAD